MQLKVLSVALCGLAIFVILIVMKFIETRSLEGFTDQEIKRDEKGVVVVKRPFVNIFDQKGRRLNVILISKPFGGDNEYKLYEEYKKDNVILGICSYLEFPNMVTNPFENFTENYKKYRYKEITEGWIHCFRNPKDYFSPKTPTLFASESDWTDCNFLTPSVKPLEKKYDFIYICLKVNEKLDKCDDWATWNKNWELAQKCLKIFCNKYKLRGLLIGRKDCPLPGGCHELMETTNMVQYKDLKKYYQQAKFIFIPNEKDASPRVLTEALSLNVPALVNKNILGGWKYVEEKTGEFFTNETDVGEKAKKLLDRIAKGGCAPRKYFIENYGTHQSGARLKEFLYKHWGDRINIPKHEVEYLTPDFNRQNYKKCQI